MWRLLTTIEAVGFIVLLSLEPLESQRSGAAQVRSGGALSSVSGAPRLSRRVIASYHAEQERGRSPELVLAVLWRGQPDWPARARGPGGHGEEGTSLNFTADSVLRRSEVVRAFLR